MIETNSLTKNQLIENLWNTDEMLKKQKLSKVSLKKNKY